MSEVSKPEVSFSYLIADVQSIVIQYVPTVVVYDDDSTDLVYSYNDIKPNNDSFRNRGDLKYVKGLIVSSDFYISDIKSNTLFMELRYITYLNGARVICSGDISGLFNESLFNGDVSCWDTSRVTSMAGLFSGAVFNKDLPWDVSGVSNMSYMFSGSRFKKDISHWDVSSVEHVRNMFEYAAFNLDISRWHLVSLVDSEGMFLNSRVPPEYRPIL